jgi:hypothetical protein
MTELKKLINEIVNEIVPITDDKEAILESIKLEENFGGMKSTNILDKYEKIIEALIK